MSVTDLLQRSELFSGLTPEQIEQIAALSQEAVYNAGDVIIREGDPSDDQLRHRRQTAPGRDCQLGCPAARRRPSATGRRTVRGHRSHRPDSTTWGVRLSTRHLPAGTGGGVECADKHDADDPTPLPRQVPP